MMKKLMVILLVLTLVVGPLWMPSNVEAAPGSPLFTTIHAQYGTSFALDQDGRIWAWGQYGNLQGQFGNGTTISSTTPIVVEVLDGVIPVTFQKVRAGTHHAMALDEQGYIWVTGEDEHEALGNGAAGSIMDWTKLPITDGSADVVFSEIAPIRGASIALDSDGQLWVWGRHTTGTPDVPVKYPVYEGGTPVEFKRISGNNEAALALDRDNRLWHLYTVSLNPFKYSQTAMVAFRSISTGSQLGMGGSMFTALDEGGNLWTWGNDHEGALGNGPGHTDSTQIPIMRTIEDAGTPVAFTQVSAGKRHALALDGDGNLWAWGNNASGQLGHDSGIISDAPVKVQLLDEAGNPLSLLLVSASDDRSSGLDANGHIWEWGLGQSTPQKKRVTSVTTLTTSNLTPDYLASITLTADVHGDFGEPTGTVTFRNGSEVLGTETLVNGSAQLTGVTLSPGTHELTIFYEGDDIYEVSTSDVVSVAASANPAKAITAFDLASPTTTGVVDESAHTVTLTVRHGTKVSALMPTITHTGASVSPSSGVAQDFSAPVTYTVTAADGSTQNYTVTVTAAAPEHPTQLTAIRADRQVSLNWGTVTGATYYEVYVSTEPGSYTEPAVARVTDERHLVSGLTNGVTYYFIVKSGDGAGLNVASIEASATPATWPGAPTAVTASMEGGVAVVSFTPPVNDGGSAITGYEVRSFPGDIVVKGASSPIKITGMSSDVSYTFTVKARNEVGNGDASHASNPVMLSTPVVIPNAAYVAESMPLAEVFINDHAIPVVTTVRKSNGISQLKIMANQAELEKRLMSEDQGASITYRTNSGFDKVAVELSGQSVQMMRQQSAVVRLQQDDAQLVWPTQQLNRDDLSAAFGKSLALKDLTFTIEMDLEIAEDTAQSIRQEESQEAFSLLASPIIFNVKATYADRTIELSKFNTFLEVWITLPEQVNPASATAAIMMEADGRFRTLPIQVVEKEGRHYARVTSLTLGTFAVVSKSVDFTDARDHWANEAIHDMGARMIVKGTGDKRFEPNREVTRGEFAAMLVQGFGLPLETGSAPFSDVSSDAWFHDVVHTAYVYGLVSGFEDGTFHPKETITREQAMIMLVRAMKLSGRNADSTDQSADEVLLPYSDATTVSRWAKEAVAASIQAGIIHGRSDGRIAPQALLTRAEAAAIMQRFLQLSKFI